MAPRVGLRVITMVAASGLLVQPGWGQTGRGGAAGGGASSPTGSTGTGSITTTPGTTTGTTTGRPTTNPTTPTNPTTQPTTMPQPIFLSGRVLLEDGSPPPESVVIERVCGGSPHAEGYTDSKGYFGIQLGQNRGIIQDASESSGTGGFGDPMGSRSGMSGAGGGLVNSGAMADNRFMNCDLQAKLAGYRSQTVNLANRRAMDNPDIGNILLHRLGPSEGTTVSTSSLAAPKDARKAYDKGMDAIKKKKWEDAAKSFQKATEIYPDYASAWYELGRLQGAGGAPDSARISFECAVKADPKYAAPLVELASLDVQAKKWKEVAATTEKAMRLDSFDYPELFFFNAAANYYLRNADAAEKSVRQALRLDTRHRFPQSAYLLGLILVNKRDLSNAAEQFRTFLQLAPDSADAGAAKQKLEQIQQISAQGGIPVSKQDQ